MTAAELRGAIAEILAREGASAAAAKKIQRLMASDRFADLKAAPDALGVSPRTMYRMIRAGRLKTVEMAGRRLVDLVAVNGSNHKVTVT